MHKMRKILLVEDDKTLSKNLRDYLIQEQFDVDCQFDGYSALQKINEKSYDAIILDIDLPIKNGWEVCREIRAHNDPTPILMLTAFDDFDDKIQGFEIGADDYITKPFFMKEVVARLKAILKRFSKKDIKAEEKIWVHDLLIDTLQKKVFRNNTPIDLTQREYNLLVKLAAAKGNIVSKKEINHSIWEGSLDENNNTIEVYINFLRKKIDKPFDTHLLRTKIGFGYYLSAHEYTK
jgi:DNA-binding response OmpR family regulator